MEWQAYALDRKSDSPCDFDVDHCERYGYAGSPVDHLIQVTVARIEVFFVVASEAELIKQRGVQRCDYFYGVQRVSPLASEIGEVIEPFEVEFNIEPRILFGGDEQHRLRKIDPLIIERYDLGESASCVRWWMR